MISRNKTICNTQFSFSFDLTLREKLRNIAVELRIRHTLKSLNSACRNIVQILLIAHTFTLGKHSTALVKLKYRFIGTFLFLLALGLLLRVLQTCSISSCRIVNFLVSRYGLFLCQHTSVHLANTQYDTKYLKHHI
jgi:hypothetical protein